jgi:hypothetical protein
MEVPFFVQSRGPLTGWTIHLTERRQTMAHPWFVENLAREHRAQLLREAEAARRVLGSGQVGKFRSGLKSLLILLIPHA